MKKWFLEVVQDFDGSYYANLTIDAIPVKELPEYVDYNTLKKAIKEQTGIEILNRNDMIFQQNGRKKYAYIDATLERKDCRVTLDEIYRGWEPDFDSVWITVYKDTLGYLDEVDNLTEILVPKKWLIEALKVVEGVEDYKQWRSEYTADHTITIAQKALREGVIQACSDENISFEKNIKNLSSDNKDVLQALQDVVVLTCTHETRYGACSYVSFHSSEEEVEKYSDFVAEDVGYYEERDDENFYVDIKHYDFSQFPHVKPLEIKQDAVVKGAVASILPKPATLEETIKLAEEQKNNKSTDNKVDRNLSRDF